MEKETKETLTKLQEFLANSNITRITFDSDAEDVVIYFEGDTGTYYVSYYEAHTGFSETQDKVLHVTERKDINTIFE